jgi:hypothetical protein
MGEEINILAEKLFAGVQEELNNKVRVALGRQLRRWRRLQLRLPVLLFSGGGGHAFGHAR